MRDVHLLPAADGAADGAGGENCEDVHTVSCHDWEEENGCGCCKSEWENYNSEEEEEVDSGDLLAADVDRDGDNVREVHADVDTDLDADLDDAAADVEDAAADVDDAAVDDADVADTDGVPAENAVLLQKEVPTIRESKLIDTGGSVFYHNQRDCPPHCGRVNSVSYLLPF